MASSDPGAVIHAERAAPVADLSGPGLPELTGRIQP